MFFQNAASAVPGLDPRTGDRGNTDGPTAGQAFGRAGRVQEKGVARLLFGRMHEDSALECSIFSPGGRVFCIASAGCTVIALASQGRPVDAVDIHPSQVRYVQERLSGNPIREGAADRMLRLARRAPGPSRAELESFLLLDDPAQQVRAWNERFQEALLHKLLAPRILHLYYGNGFLHGISPGFAEDFRRRFELGFRTHPNRRNPYIWNLLLGCDPPDAVKLAPITIPPQVVCADAVEFLENGPAQRYDAFALSNIEDGASIEYCDRLRRAVRRAAKPGAAVVLRSLQNAEDPVEAEHAAQDRSMLWGRIRITRSI